MSLGESIQKLNELDLNDIDFENIGTWPLAGRVAVWAIVAVLTLAGGYFFVIDPQITTLNTEINREAEKRQRFESFQIQAASIDVYRAQLAQIEESFSTLLSQLPSKTEVPGLLDDVSETGINAGLSFDLIQLNPEVARDYYVELPISIKVRGGYHDLANFVSGVAALPRIVTLHDFKVVGMDSADLQMEVKAATYRYKEEAE